MLRKIQEGQKLNQPFNNTSLKSCEIVTESGSRVPARKIIPTVEELIRLGRVVKIQNPDDARKHYLEVVQPRVAVVGGLSDDS